MRLAYELKNHLPSEFDFFEVDEKEVQIFSQNFNLPTLIITKTNDEYKIYQIESTESLFASRDLNEVIDFIIDYFFLLLFSEEHKDELIEYLKVNDTSLAALLETLEFAYSEYPRLYEKHLERFFVNVDTAVTNYASPFSSLDIFEDMRPENFLDKLVSKLFEHLGFAEFTYYPPFERYAVEFVYYSPELKRFIAFNISNSLRVFDQDSREFKEICEDLKELYPEPMTINRIDIPPELYQ